MTVIYVALAVAVLVGVAAVALEILRLGDETRARAELDEREAAEHSRPHGSVHVLERKE